MIINLKIISPTTKRAKYSIINSIDSVIREMNNKGLSTDIDNKSEFTTDLDDVCTLTVDEEDLAPKIMSELYKTLTLMGAPSGLLDVVGYYRDCMSDESVYESLLNYNFLLSQELRERLDSVNK